MSTFRKKIRAHLLTKSTITDVVGTRIYTPPTPQKPTRPYLTLHRADETPEYYLGGASGRDWDLWQIDCMASTETASEELREIVKAVLQAETGPQSWDGWAVYGNRVQSTADLYEMNKDGSVGAVHGKAMTIRVSRSNTE
jgi:hypothetical protein